jgi:hypothetical protein
MAGNRGTARCAVALAAVLLGGASGVIGAPPPAGAVLATPYTFAFIDRPATGPSFGSATVTPHNATGPSAAVFDIAPEFPSIGFDAPAGNPLAIGDYQVGTDAPGDGTLTLDSRPTCTPQAGHFVVGEVAFDPTGNVLRFSARFDVACAEGGRAQGAVSYNSTVDFAHRIITPDRLDLGVVHPGRSSDAKTITYSNFGPSDAHIASITKSGVDPSEFTMNNSCGAVVAAHAWCTISVRLRPTSVGSKEAVVTITDDVATAGHDIEVVGSAIGLVTRVLTTNPSKLSFGEQRVGTYGIPATMQLRNDGTTTLHFKAFLVGGASPLDYFGGTNCPLDLVPGETCLVRMYFVPTRQGWRDAQLVVRSNATNGTLRKSPMVGSGTLGYFLARANGAVEGFGDATVLPHGGAVTAPVVGMATTVDGDGYWLTGRDGNVYPGGDAAPHGTLRGLPLTRPIVGIAATPTGDGYWLVASDGGIFAFGDARFFGSTGAMRLNQPIVGMASTVTGRGYWLVASDGGIFAFGDARFFGSTGAMRLNQPIVGMAPTPSGRGYWLVASDGGIFAFGDAHFYGSTGALRLVSPIVGMQPAPNGRGYWFVARDGGLFSFGSGVSYYGSLATGGVNDVVAMAGTAPALTWLYASAATGGTRIGTPHGRPAR